MRPWISLILVLGIVGCASKASLAQGPDDSGLAAAKRATLEAERAAVIGNWAVVVSLLERAYSADPSLGNEFNLATAYARNGQVSLAVTLYEDVAKKGQFNSAAPIYSRNDDGKGAPRKTFNYSDEALRRIALLTGQAFPTSP